MHRSIAAWIGMFFMIAITLLSTSATVDVVAQSILEGNSNTTITAITYQLNISELNLSNRLLQWYDNETNRTKISNLTHLVTHTCMFSIDGQNYFSSGTTGNMSAIITITHTLNSPLLDGYYAGVLNCLYLVNATNITDNMTVFNVSTVSILTNKNILIDAMAPIISVYNTTLVRMGDFAYLELDLEDISPLNCSLLYIDVVPPMPPVYFNSSDSSINITSNQTLNHVSVRLPMNIIAGNYTVNIICGDASGNIMSVNSSLYISDAVDEIPYFYLNLSKSTFGLGEMGYFTVSASNNSNVSITICPIASGWVQCYMTPAFVNETFPKTHALPYTNKSGVYLVEAVMHYKNYTMMANTSYETVNTLVATIKASKTKAGTGDTIIFNATASSGVGGYTYRWIMHDGSIITGPGAFKVYNTAGTFTVNLSVNDSIGNRYNTSSTVTIKNYYTLNIIVVDSKDNKRIKNATIEMGDENKQTDSNGFVSFKLLEDDYKLYISKENYERYSDNIDVKSTSTIYINMTFQDVTPPEVELLTADDIVMGQDSVNLKFKADDVTNIACSLYISDLNTSWYQLKDSGDNLLTNTEYTFELRDLTGGAYKWKVECSDLEGNKALSEERKFFVSGGDITIALNGADEDYDSINSALDNMNKISGDESEVADILNIREELKDLLDRISLLERDIHDLAYRRDLDESGKKKAQENLIAKIESMKKNTPVGLSVEDSKTFVKYIRDDDLKELLDEYSTIKNLKIDKKLLLESTKLAQSKIVVSTRVRNVELYYLDGSTKDITLVTKDIQVAKSEEDSMIRNSNTMSFVEVIPKTIVHTAKQINMVTKQHTILKDDPIIEYPPSTETIIYYINDTLPLDAFEDSDTIVIEKNLGVMKTATGFSILGVESISDIHLTGQNIMMILIILLILFYILLNFDIIERIREVMQGTAGFGSKKRVSFIKVLVNDAQDYLKTDDYDKAALIYREVKLSYEGANYYVKRQVYDESLELCNQIDMNYALKVLEKIEYYIHINDKNKAMIEFGKLESTYNKLNDKYQSQIAEQFKRVALLLRSI